jgi:hypothetical protein
VLVSDHTPSERHGVMLGARMALNYAAQAASALLVGPLVAVAGYGVALGGAGALAAALAVTTLRRRSLLDRVAR